MIDLGRRLMKVTRQYAIPLIVNDRVDVALAIGADGVHVGQVRIVRKHKPCTRIQEIHSCQA